MLTHWTPLNISQINTLEPDNGVSTISTWFELGDFDHVLYNNIHFYQIPEDTQLVSAKPKDGQTSKLAKSVHAQGLKENMEYSHSGIRTSYTSSYPTEIAFYRRYRDHNNITNENQGGLILQNCFSYLSPNTFS